MAALGQLANGANMCDDNVVSGTAAGEGDRVVSSAFKAHELYMSDVAQRFVLDSCDAARDPGAFFARQRLGAGDKDFVAPKDQSVLQNYSPHIARLVLFLARIAARQAGGQGGSELPPSVPPLHRDLKSLVDEFVEAARADMPAEWVTFCTGDAQPPKLETRLASLPRLRDGTELSAKLQAVFRSLYLTKMELYVT